MAESHCPDRFKLLGWLCAEIVSETDAVTR